MIPWSSWLEKRCDSVCKPHKNKEPYVDGWLRFINYSHFLPPQGGSTSKILSPGSGDTSVRQKDLWFERISDRAGGEAEMIMADSVFNDGMNVCQLHNSLSSRGRGELQSDWCLCRSRILLTTSSLRFSLSIIQNLQFSAVQRRRCPLLCGAEWPRCRGKCQ